MKNAEMAVTKFSNEDVIATSSGTYLINVNDGQTGNVKLFVNGVDKTSEYLSNARYPYTFVVPSKENPEVLGNFLGKDIFEDDENNFYKSYYVNGKYTFDNDTDTFTKIQ